MGKKKSAALRRTEEGTPVRARVQAYLQLMRFPNVFTACSDLTMGFLLTHANVDRADLLALLLLSSCCLYLSGMVLNDVFDLEVDQRERPFRPLPSGRVRVSDARFLGWTLLLTGASVGWFVSMLTDEVRPGLTASVLAGLIVLYNARAKQTVLGPFVMGSCRLTNVLLGMSLAIAPWEGMHFAAAGGIGVYIVGVTLFARQEADTSDARSLIGGLFVMAGGIGLLALVPWLALSSSHPLYRPLASLDARWWMLLAMLAGLIGRVCVVAIMSPDSRRVQGAVKHCLISLIMLDACLVLAFHGWLPAVVLLALLVPTMLLGRWIYST